MYVHSTVLDSIEKERILKLFIISLLSVIISSAVTYYYISNINGVTTLLSIDINRINHETYIRLIKEGKIERLITALEQNIYCDFQKLFKAQR